MDGFRHARILIVEDYADTAESLACLLRSLGCQTEIARDGAEAVESSGRFKPHLILMDLVLPVLDGFEACREIRRQCWGEKPTIVALTGMGRSDEQQRSRAAGFDHFLVKPVSVEAIEDLLPTVS